MPLYYYEPYVSGVSVYAKRLAEGLVEQGFDVTVLTSRFEKNLPKEEMINGVRVVRRPVLFSLGKGVIMPTFWWDMIRFSRQADYVNPHLPMVESGLASLFIPKRKIITKYHCDINLGPGIFNRLVTFISLSLMKLQLRRSKVVIASSMDYAAHSKMKRFLPKFQAIYPPIPAVEFTSVASDRLFKKLGVPSGSTKIGFVGRLVYEKGISYLLESIEYLQADLKDFKIIIAGDYEKVAGGSIKESLDTYLQKYPGQIIFTGFLSDQELRQFYSGLDVFVLPSIDPLEAFGMVQVEAMLCGASVVASDLPGVRVVVQQTGYGRIAKRMDARDIAKQIIEVVQHPKQYQPDRKQLVRQFDTSNTIEAYAKLMVD